MNKKLLLTSLGLTSILLVSCNKTPEKTDAENFEIFKQAVTNEMSYTGTLQQDLKLDVKLEPHYYDGDKELTKEEATKLQFSLEEVKLQQSKVKAYDADKKTILNLTGEAKADKLEDFFYIENDTEYRCFTAKEKDKETNKYVEVKKRESLDAGHIETIRGIKELDDIDIFEGVESYDDLLNKFGDIVHTLPGAEDFDMSGFSIETTTKDSKYVMTINAPIKFNLLGQIDIDGKAVGKLTYTEDKIENFNIDLSGFMSMEQSKTVEGVEKKYLQKNTITGNVIIDVKHELTESLSEKDFNEFKAKEAKPARKQGVMCDSVIGNEAFKFTKEEISLPKTLATLENSEVKIYEDKKHTKEIKLEDIKNKTYEQKYYATVTPKEGYALVVEIVNDPTPLWGGKKIAAKEIKVSDQGFYEIQEVINITGGWVECPFNGKQWTEIYIDGNLVEVGEDRKLTLESKQIFTVEYKFIEEKAEK